MPAIWLTAFALVARVQAAMLESSGISTGQQTQAVTAEERERRSIDAAMEAWLVGFAEGRGALWG